MSEFLSIIIIHFLAVIAPGPEVILVTKDSLSQGRSYAVWLSIGIGSGTLLHVGYSLLGIGLIISQSTLLFSIIKILGALYLIYLGILSLKAQPVQLDNLTTTTADSTKFSIPQVLLKGFMTSALNPKATLFFFSIFTVLISPETALITKIGYGSRAPLRNRSVSGSATVSRPAKLMMVVSSMVVRPQKVGGLCSNDKPTRCTANFQINRTPDSGIARSRVVRPSRLPVSVSTCLTHSFNVWGAQLMLLTFATMAAHRLQCSLIPLNTIWAARWRTSGE